jgi:uncharacterized protein with HEPN domain
MSFSPIDYLHHIRDEASFIISITKERSKEEVLEDKLIVRAVERSVEIIGEATKNLDYIFRNKYPQLDWKKMAGMRDVLIHEYFGVDKEILWRVISDKLDELLFEIDRIISIEDQK